MTHKTIDLKDWDRSNLAILPSGEVAVRPGLRRIWTPDSTRKIVDGFSLRNPATEEQVHYFTTVLTASANPMPRIEVYDEDFQLFQTLPIDSQGIPRIVTHAAVSGQVLITSPDFSAVWGAIGGQLQIAKPKASVNTYATEIPIPKGICVAWADRAVVAEGNAVYFSDGFQPRTFVAGNFAVGGWVGRIYGLAVTSDHTLVVGTQDGIYVLPFDAISTGQFVNASLFTKANDEAFLSYDALTTTRGGVWATTRRGVRRLLPQGDEVFTTQRSVQRVYGPRVDYEDYRDGRLYGGQYGLYLSVDDNLWFRDEQRKFDSWWTNPNRTTFRMRGLAEVRNGEELIVAEDGLYRVIGNFDGDIALSSEGTTTVKGIFAGVIVASPAEAQKVARIHVASDTGGNIVATHQGSSQTATPSQNEERPPVAGITINTDSWGDGNYYLEPRLRSEEFLFNSGLTGEASIEVGAENPLSRIDPRADVELRGPGGKRSTS